MLTFNDLCLGSRTGGKVGAMVCQIFKRSAAGRTLDISGFSSSVRVMLEMDWFSAGENVKK